MKSIDDLEVELIRYEPPDDKHRANERVRNGGSCQIDECPNIARTVGEIIGKHAGWKAICSGHEAQFSDW